jgi:hypothetical protein
VNKYAFVALTGRSIEHHLLNHRIRKPMADVTAETTGKRTARTFGTMAQYLNIHTSNPQHQELLTKLAELHNPRISNLLLLNWIVMGNHPFSVVENARFRRYIKSINPAAKIPNRTTLRNLLAKEYQLTIPQVRKILQSALGMIHFTFDGWTSRQNDSFLGVTGHFIDKN